MKRSLLVAVSLAALSLAVAVASCGSPPVPPDDGHDAGTGDGGGASDAGGTGGGTGDGGGAGDGGGGSGGDDGGGTGGGDGGTGGGTDDGGAVDYDGGCGPIRVGNPPYPRRCAPPTTSECYAATDTFLANAGVPVERRNGSSGNGFDDDCDGLVDEGCSCPGNGQTKACYLVPATMASATDGVPVGWCAGNSKGSLDCLGVEFSQWSGTCRGAQPPYAHDTCTPGDFDCDGLDANPDNTGCECGGLVTCPSSTLTLAPFPEPTAIPKIDGWSWIDGGAAAAATGWRWTVLGGDCDNVLPNPTFALYSGPNTATSTRVGARRPLSYDASQSPARYVERAGAPLAGVVASHDAGFVHTAFALSGDYVVQGEFDLEGKRYVCTQKVAVRAPGLRAELCWDTVGGEGGSDAGNDVDLHVARLQGVRPGAVQGWDFTGDAGQDCYYSPTWSGCPSRATGHPENFWGYPPSVGGCLGWGSYRGAGRACTNPRLDRDNITCDPAVLDPNDLSFCGPENINLDNPNDGDRFVVGVNHYRNTVGTAHARPHVNLYCNGERIISLGYNPATGASWPRLTRDGDKLGRPPNDSTGDTGGDFWTVGVVTTSVDAGVLVGCAVDTVPSRRADPLRDGPSATPDGGNSLCVESTDSTAPRPYLTHRFVDFAAEQGGTLGGLPPTVEGFCKH